MMSSRFRVALASLPLILAACQLQEDTELIVDDTEYTNAELVQYFNSFNPQWRQSVVENDATYIVNQYDKDALICVPGKLPIKGLEAIEEYWNSTVQLLHDFNYQTLEIGGDPKEIIYENGVAIATYNVANIEIQDTSQYLFVWEYVGENRYKVLAEMFTEY